MWRKAGKTKEPNNAEKAYDYAVFLLSLRLRTVGEIREKMEGRGYSPAVVEKTLEELRRQRYIDDQRYAEVFLDNLKAYKELGYFGVKKKFLAKKLPLDIIERVLEEGLSVSDELAIAKRVLKKEGFAVTPSEGEEETGPHYNTFDEERSKEKQKLIQKLKSRGFRGDVIAKLFF